MQEAGINVVRPYEPITDRSVLDTLLRRGIYVVNAAYAWGGAPAQSAVDVVRAVKDHPAIIMWAVGNEWNYNGLYYGLSFDAARARIADVVDLIKRNDPNHPVSTIYGELPDANTLNILRKVDVWGINAYRGISFGSMFRDWRSRSPKPMYLGEYGADAFDARFNRPNYSAQADATRNLTNEIVANSAVTGGVCVGGLIFELADEWWKDTSGTPHNHDTGGIAPGGGPYPDSTFNEEWWGLLDIDRRPRSAFQAYKDSPIPGGGSGPGPVPTPTSPPPSPQPSAACSANPGCAGLAGDCCPTRGGVRLGCCGSAGGPAPPPSPPPAAACSANPGCAGLAGSCCPTSDGVFLGCCR